jgi:hypothetical protein
MDALGIAQGAATVHIGASRKVTLETLMSLSRSAVSSLAGLQSRVIPQVRQA